MLNTILTKIIGTKNEREIKRMRPLLERITSLEPAERELSDAALAAKTAAFKERLAKGDSLDDMTQHYERQRTQDFATHVCAEHPRSRDSAPRT